MQPCKIGAVPVLPHVVRLPLNLPPGLVWNGLIRQERISNLVTGRILELPMHFYPKAWDL